MDLKKLKIDKLKNILKNEGGIVPDKGTGPKGKVTKEDIIKAINLQKPKYKDYMADIPPDITRLISNNLLPEDIPALCQTNKYFRNQCLGDNFWLNYFNKDNMTPGQINELFSDIMVEITLEGDIELFDYLWKKTLIINGSAIVKERKILYDSYMATIDTGDEEMSDYIYDLNPGWLYEKLPDGYFDEIYEKSQIKKLLIEAIEDERKSDYDENHQKTKKKSLIEILENERLTRIADLSSLATKLLSEDDIFYMLSFSPSYDSLKLYNNLLGRRELNKEEIITILYIAMSHSNLSLINYAKWEHNVDLNDDLNFLQSPSPDSLDLVRTSINSATAYKIDYLFGNEQILMDYVKNYDDELEKIMIHSLNTLSNDNYLKLFQKLIDNGINDKKEIIESLKGAGRDFLLEIILPIIQ